MSATGSQGFDGIHADPSHRERREPPPGTTSALPPSADEQLAFLARLQRLFAEGDFTATYKFALLAAFAELAVEHGSDGGEALRLTTRQIAEKFIGLYWRQAVPYGTGRPDTSPGVLVQNNGVQAAIVSAIGAFRSKHETASVQAARRLDGYAELLARVTTTVAAQPLAYLQNLGGTSVPFLYKREARGGVVLKPGVAWCLRRFHPLVHQLVRSHWMDHIRRNWRNRPILGEASDLEPFLFETPRQRLLLMGRELRKLDRAACFYCRRPLGDIDVDHFIAFAQYPRDLAHNFVLAHPACNRSKSDSLAARSHLERWLDRLDRHGDALAEIGQGAGLVGDMCTSRHVAAWSYGSARHGGGRAWVSSARYEPIDAAYLACFA